MSFNTKNIILAFCALILNACVYDSPSTTAPPKESSTFVNHSKVYFSGQDVVIPLSNHAYYPVSCKQGTLYTRDSVFRFNKEGYLETLDGCKMLGKAIRNNEMSPSLSPIQISPDLIINNEATSKVTLSGNLAAFSAAKGSILYTQSYLTKANLNTPIISLINSKGENLALKKGDRMQISFASTSTLYTIKEAGGVWTLGDIVHLIPGAVWDSITGKIQLPKTYSISTSAPLASAKIATIFACDSYSYTNVFLSPADSTTPFSNLYDSQGYPLFSEINDDNPSYLHTGDTIQVFGQIGGKDIKNTHPLIVQKDLTLGDLVEFIRTGLQLPVSSTDHPSVFIQTQMQDYSLPLGSIVIHSQLGLSSAISNLNIFAVNDLGSYVILFNMNNSTTEHQKASDARINDLSIPLYDQLGKTHNMTISFVPTQNFADWEWVVSFSGNEKIQTGGKGKLSFGQDGSVSSFSYDDHSARLMLDPSNGADILEIELDMGGPGNFKGLTQFNAAFSTKISANGFGFGVPDSLQMDESGSMTIKGTNGSALDVYQIKTYSFPDQNQLQTIRPNLFKATMESGSAGIYSTKLRTFGIKGLELYE